MQLVRSQYAIINTSNVRNEKEEKKKRKESIPVLPKLLFASYMKRRTKETVTANMV